jgi:AcrR family transcriptional regulator
VAKKKEVKKRAPRQTPNLDEVIAVAIELLLKNGESDFRIEDVIERTGISKSSLYLHFGDRDGLVGAAYAEVFTVDTNRNIAMAIQAFSNIKTNEELDAIVPLLVEGLVQTPSDSRWNRIDILSSARYRPEFLARIIESQSRMNSALEEMFRMQQDLGLVRKDIDAREMAVLIQAVSFGRLFRDIDSRMDKDDLTKWAKLTTEVYTMFRTVKN